MLRTCVLVPRDMCEGGIVGNRLWVCASPSLSSAWLYSAPVPYPVAFHLPPHTLFQWCFGSASSPILCIMKILLFLPIGWLWSDTLLFLALKLHFPDCICLLSIQPVASVNCLFITYPHCFPGGSVGRSDSSEKRLIIILILMTLSSVSLAWPSCSYS